MRQLLKRLDALLLPADREGKYLPYLLLSYLVLFFIPVLIGQSAPWHLSVMVISTLVFLGLYFHAYHATGNGIIWHMSGMCVLAFVLALSIPTSSVFIVYACAFCMALPKLKHQYAALGGILAATAVVSLILKPDVYFYLPALFFGAIVGLLNINQKQLNAKAKALKLSQDEVKKLATVTERERIARDLHDAIGHQLSAIALKAELAETLCDHDTEKAKSIMQQVHTMSRTTLKEVREVVSNYHAANFEETLVHIKALLQLQEIEVVCEVASTDFSHAQEQTLCFILKEAVTNIVKHASATEVSLKLEIIKDHFVLSIKDNGSGFSAKGLQGNGLASIQKRAELLDGSLQINQNAGSEILVRIPK